MAVSVGDPIRYSPVTRPYRHWLAWAAALVLHMLVIGVVASRVWTPEPPVTHSSLDVVLVTQASSVSQAAEAIAEADQLASGSESEHSPAERLAAAGEGQNAHAQAEQAGASPAEARAGAPLEETGLTDTAAPPAKVNTVDNETLPGAPALFFQAMGRDQQGQAQASVRAQGIAAEYAGSAEGPGRRAARQAAEADYIDTWTRHVEAYGNRFGTAPENRDGQLRIRVVVGREGQLLQAEVIQSSGDSELDQAALDTVHGAAPYRPFDPAMAGLDSLSITRVWRFGKGNDFGVQ